MPVIKKKRLNIWEYDLYRGNEFVGYKLRYYAEIEYLQEHKGWMYTAFWDWLWEMSLLTDQDYCTDFNQEVYMI